MIIFTLVYYSCPLSNDMYFQHDTSRNFENLTSCKKSTFSEFKNNFYKCAEKLVAGILFRDTFFTIMKYIVNQTFVVVGYDIPAYIQCSWLLSREFNLQLNENEKGLQLSPQSAPTLMLSSLFVCTISPKLCFTITNIRYRKHIVFRSLLEMIYCFRITSKFQR